MLRIWRSVPPGAACLTERECNQLATAIRGLPPLPPFSESVDVAERWTTAAIVADAATGQLHYYKTDTKDEVTVTVISAIRVGFATIDRKEVDWDAVLKLMNSTYDDVVASMRVTGLGEMRDAAGGAFEAPRCLAAHCSIGRRVVRAKSRGGPGGLFQTGGTSDPDN